MCGYRICFYVVYDPRSLFSHECPAPLLYLTQTIVTQALGSHWCVTFGRMSHVPRCSGRRAHSLRSLGPRTHTCPLPVLQHPALYRPQGECQLVCWGKYVLHPHTEYTLCVPGLRTGVGLLLEFPSVSCLWPAWRACRGAGG